jgi:hypothetical protein
MSNLDKTGESLDRVFHREGARIVFWDDPEREYLNVLPLLSIEDVTRRSSTASTPTCRAGRCRRCGRADARLSPRRAD